MNLELLLDFFERPDFALRRVWSTRPVGLGLLAYALAASSLLFAQGAWAPLPSPRWLPWALGLWVAWGISSGLLFCAVAHAVSQALGGRGSFSGLFVLAGLSELPWCVAPPAALVLRALRAGPGSWMGAFFLLWGLTLFFKLRSLRGHYGLSASRACAALVLPHLLVAASLWTGTLVGTWWFASLWRGA